MSMKRIPKTAKGRADRIRSSFQKKAGVSSLGLTKSRTGEVIWDHTASPAMVKQIAEATKKMGGKVFYGGKESDGKGGFVRRSYAVFK